jgi:hypothetical protein
MAYVWKGATGVLLMALVSALDAFAQSAQSAQSAQPATNAPAREARADGSYGTGTIKGQVVDAVTGRGLPRVALELNGGKPAGSAGETTDDDGRFVFSGLPPGSYSIQAAKTSYEGQRLPETRRGRRIRFLEVAQGATLENVTITMHRASAITGRVVDRFGEPVQGARISLRTFPTAGRAPQRFNGVWGGQTNDIGEFRLAPVPAGRYLLIAQRDVQPFGFPGPRPQEPGFVAYPQAPAIDQAQPLIVERGEDAQSIELQLFPTRIAKVTGVILGPDGAPAQNATISVGFFNVGDSHSYGGAGTEARNGRFELTLAPGTYALRASVVDRRGSNALTSAQTRITVSGEPIDGLTLQLGPPRTIAGRMRFVSALAPPPATARVFVRTGDDCEAGEATVNPDLTFTVQVSGDACGLMASASGRWFVQSITQGTDDAMFGGVRFGERAAVNDVVITFSDNPTRVSAVVSDAKGRPADEFMIVVFPADKSRRPRSSETWNNGVVREVGPGRGDGPVSLNGLLPGEYFVVAVHPDAYDAGQPPYDDLEPVAQRITLGDGERRVLALQLADVSFQR